MMTKKPGALAKTANSSTRSEAAVVAACTKAARFFFGIPSLGTADPSNIDWQEIDILSMRPALHTVYRAGFETVRPAPAPRELETLEFVFLDIARRWLQIESLGDPESEETQVRYIDGRGLQGALAEAYRLGGVTARRPA